MHVLVACEYSGRVRDAFLAQGHDAWSCDIKPTEVPGPHFQMDVLELLKKGMRPWDMLLAFPPCTYLTRANAWRWDDIAYEREKALRFIRWLMDLSIPRIAIENPAGAIGTHIRPADQYVHPWWFGEPWQKQTGLWLKNLPKLQRTHEKPSAVQPWVDGFYPREVDGEKKYVAVSAHRLPKDRSRTSLAIAAAMAEQWGSLCNGP